MKFGDMPKEVLTICCVLSFFNLHGKVMTEEKIPGCRLFNDSDYNKGLYAFCDECHPNPLVLLPTTTRLQIYRVFDLPTDAPLVFNAENLKTLQLRNNRLTHVTAQMLKGLTNLSAISLRENFITKLPTDVFKNNLYLERVDLSFNFLLSVSGVTNSLGYLKLLKHLYLSNNKAIRWISDGDFESLAEVPLRSLDVSDCNIEIIESDAFKWLVSLSSLNLSRTLLGETALRNLTNSFHLKNLKDFRLTEMKFLPFFSPYLLRWLSGSGIEYFDPSRNRFTHFPLGSYPQLKVLNMVNCDIKVLYSAAFVGMPKLEVLVIKPHSITSLDQQFVENVHLKFLDLSELLVFSETVRISDFAFENQKLLEVLHLNKLPLRKQRISRYLLHGLSRLQEIGLRKDSIIYIDDYSFETLGSLLTLDLSYNLISELSNNSFYGLLNVKNINLATNKLSFLSASNPFKYTNNLEVLNLKSNQILHFPTGIFLNLFSLGYIEASDNFIQPWTDNLVPRSGNLTVLFFSKNRITHFTPEMFEDVSVMDFVDFSQNPINCSFCSTKRLQAWMAETNTTIRTLSHDGNNYACANPSSLKGTSLNEADLDFLKIYCSPSEINVSKMLFSFLIPLLSIFLIAALVWYRWSWNVKYVVFLTRSRTRKYRDHLISNRFSFDAFVSYCETDVTWVRDHLLPAIEREELRLCLPDRDFIAGQTVIENVASAVGRSRTVILVLSNAYMDSNWCRFEAEVAQHRLLEDTGTGLIVVLLEPIRKEKATQSLQYVIRTRTCMQWTDNATGQKLFWERLRLAIMDSRDKGLSTHIT